MGSAASVYLDPYDYDAAINKLEDPVATYTALVRPGTPGIIRDDWTSVVDDLELKVSSANVERAFSRADKDCDTFLSENEFNEFCTKAAKEAAEPTLDMPSIRREGLCSYLGPVEAAHGFRKALAALRRDPSVAKVPAAGGVPGNEWLPVHSLLMTDDATAVRQRKEDAAARGEKDTNKGGLKAEQEAAKAARAAAIPLVKALLEAHPEGASHRVMAGAQYVFPWGHSALSLALTRRWDTEVVGLILKAWPNGACTMEPLDPKMAKKMSKPNAGKCRFPSKIAAESYEDGKLKDQIVALLPTPGAKKKGRYTWFVENGAVQVDEFTLEPLPPAPPKKGKKGK